MVRKEKKELFCVDDEFFFARCGSEE